MVLVSWTVRILRRSKQTRASSHLGKWSSFISYQSCEFFPSTMIPSWNGAKHMRFNNCTSTSRAAFISLSRKQCNDLCTLKIEITFNLSYWKWYADGMKGNLVMVVDFVVDLSCQIKSVSLSFESRRVILCFYSVFVWNRDILKL